MKNRKLDSPECQRLLRNRQAFLTIDGQIELARAGDRPAIDQLITAFTMKVKNGRTPAPEILQWVSDAFVKVVSGESADRAFRLKPGKKGRPKSDSDDLELRYEIAISMQSNSSPSDRGSIDRIIQLAAEKYPISDGTARQIYDAYKVGE